MVDIAAEQYRLHVEFRRRDPVRRGKSGHRGPGQQPPADRYITGSDLDALIAECGPRLWLCGHAHTTDHVTVGNTRISANPRAGDGPGNVNPDFVDSCVLDL